MTEQPELLERIARTLCAEKNAVYGEPPCWRVEGPWPNPDCGDCTCHDLADAVLSALSPQPPLRTQEDDVKRSHPADMIDAMSKAYLHAAGDERQIAERLANSITLQHHAAAILQGGSYRKFLPAFEAIEGLREDGDPEQIFSAALRAIAVDEAP